MIACNFTGYGEKSEVKKRLHVTRTHTLLDSGTDADYHVYAQDPIVRFCNISYVINHDMHARTHAQALQIQLYRRIRTYIRTYVSACIQYI
jgi:hypothetical protein